MTDDYSDMLFLPHPTSKKHPRMARAARAAQFSPFAALTGFDGVIDETGRLTAPKRVLTEEEQEALNASLAALRERLRTRPRVRVTFFQPDTCKDGGAEVMFSGILRDIDTVERRLVFYGGKSIPIDDLCAVFPDGATAQ